MANFDFSPLFRSTIGFDRLSRLMESALSYEDTGYPPYNIEKTGNDSYRITMAVAGFAADDVTITCLLYTSPSPRDGLLSRMPSSA